VRLPFSARSSGRLASASTRDGGCGSNVEDTIHGILWSSLRWSNLFNEFDAFGVCLRQIRT